MKKQLKAMKKNQKGFTLVELIVVIAILGVLIAMMVPSIMGYVGDARKQTNVTNARTIASAAQIANASLDKPIKNYTPTFNGSVWVCAGGSDATNQTKFKTTMDTSSKMDGYAAVKIDTNGRIEKVVYNKTDAVADTSATTNSETVGIWVAD